MTTLLEPALATGSLLRLATAGSVDDGKSTLVGRLLHDLRVVMPDQLAAVERVSRERGLAAPDLALLTDGLRAEREQGITIDVAYRYFATPKRRFILADTPGHVQYTRNMVTGASTAQLAVILVDARHGVVEQTRRHAAVAALLRVPQIVLLVNKMDLVGFDKNVYAEISADFERYLERLGVDDPVSIPISALRGDNVVEPSAAMDWYQGPTLLRHLEEVPPAPDPAEQRARFPVQYVIRVGEHDYRGYAGQLVSGVLRPGDDVVVLPSNRRSTIAGIDIAGRPVNEAFAPQSVTLRLADDLDVARGELIATAGSAPEPTRELTATVCHLAERTLRAGDRVLLRHTTRTVQAIVTELVHTLDVTTLETGAGPEALHVNDIARIRLRTAEPIAADDYAVNRHTGSFVLIDPSIGDTLTAGLIGGRP
ncbi:50S ribosome-binding GTPase [Actinospica sp. MGRD01-02]|uniref:sulfate adenylyltransferase n=1 Tax=Actinospica acidithermotolerans TaxID=2828514 RepID=A0A941EMU9_9ACTN|nr:GTP-binding protein [Actinospica acidithermotolerans]MBR7830434.1 50S ribosome-binding GTPase [Actinospica acidithermotolerans]